MPTQQKLTNKQIRTYIKAIPDHSFLIPLLTKPDAAREWQVCTCHAHCD